MLNDNDKIIPYDFYERIDYSGLYESLPNLGHVRERDMTDAIFGYAYYACTDGGDGEDYDEFSVILFRNGLLEYREYLYGGWIKKEKIYPISKRYVKQVLNILDKYQEKIDLFTNTDNDMCDDGAANYFYFWKKMDTFL